MALGSRVTAVIMASVVLTYSLSTSADADSPKPNAQAAYAAARIWGYEADTEATLGLCREMDSANAAAYDRLYHASVTATAPTMARVYGILTEESIRSGMPPDTATKRLDPSMPRLVAKQTAESNPSLFIEEQCRLSIGHEAEMGRLLESVLPDDLKLIEAWH
jgi:hypothetical protein